MYTLSKYHKRIYLCMIHNLSALMTLFCIDSKYPVEESIESFHQSFLLNVGNLSVITDSGYEFYHEKTSLRGLGHFTNQPAHA